jgi:tetratricopeptide (TPR) repeat protein
MIERIGGVDRPRAFASATAYEAYLRAELAVARGEPAIAARQLELAQIADPSDGYLASRRAEVLLLAGDRDGALEAAQDASQRFPDQAAAWLVLGEVRAERGDRAGASAAFTHALGLAPEDPEVRGAVASAQGAPLATVAHAIESAPDARAGDRTAAQRLALDPMRDDRPTLRSVRRERAHRAWLRHDYREVDAILSPLVEADARDAVDRVRVIEARAADGRLLDAARLVAGVPIGSSDGVSPAEHARLWLLAGRPELAAEEAERAVHADPNDVLARVVSGEAWVRSGRVAEGVLRLAAIPPSSSEFVSVRIVAAEGLALEGRGEAADTSLARAIAAIPAAAPGDRDRLRLARARLLLSRGLDGEARAVLADVESPAGRQERGAMLTLNESPALALNDLRSRSNDPWQDGVADAWVALLCSQNPSACAPNERDRALASARQHAPTAPETLRALAVASSDRRAATDLLREAALRDPLSPWNGLLSRQLGYRNSPSP